MVVTSNRNRLRSTLGSVQSTSDDKSQQLKPSTGLKAESESMQRQAVRDRIDSDWGKAVRERNLAKCDSDFTSCYFRWEQSLHQSWLQRVNSHPRFNWGLTESMQWGFPQNKMLFVLKNSTLRCPEIMCLLLFKLSSLSFMKWWLLDSG